MDFLSVTCKLREFFCPLWHCWKMQIILKLGDLCKTGSAKHSRLAAQCSREQLF